ncbi:MAG: SRPBCC family protein [Bacteroidaceae bacterium]|nr:SRPBCC family protein [Bacteroidaceae bacterium]MBQ9170600.1 SRPBCC family protein [Bacteroidaceae bacterium]MBQ9171487.1 SRPBCC family protein [Bacteroidaceae bacterium]
MTEYKSEVKKIYAPIERVYERLSDLNNLAVIQQGLDNPEAMERIKQQAGDKVTPEQLEQVVEKLRELQFDRDSVSGNTPMGTATLRIIEREPEKTIKFAAEGMPVAANMWIQLLPQNDNECAMRLTVKADLNFFIRQMVGKKLEQGVNGLAQMLASLPY